MRRLTRLARAVATGLLLASIYAYRLLLRPFVVGGCRFEPSCSHYAEAALRLHGPVRGSWLAARRLARCHPWGEAGYDPVPEGNPHGA